MALKNTILSMKQKIVLDYNQAPYPQVERQSDFEHDLSRCQIRDSKRQKAQRNIKIYKSVITIIYPH